jgi:type IV pilus biogenesis/stability protein PilW
MVPNTSKLLRGFLLGLSTCLVGCAGLTTLKEKEISRIQLQRASDLLNQREYNQAIDAAMQCLRADPSTAAAHNLIALVYLETKRYEKSEEAFRKALEIQPQYPEVFNNLGVLYNRQDRFNEAIPYFQKALADETYITPENAYTNMGYSYFRLGDTRAAMDNHQKALDIAPMFCLASKNMADVYAKQKTYSKAFTYYEKAVTHCPLYQESHYKLGLVLMKMGQRKVAKAELEKLVRRHKSGPYVERSSEVLKWLK